MKAQFKYAFKTGLSSRGAAFAVILVIDTVFIALGSHGLLPLPALVTAVLLGRVTITVMLVFNIIGDIAILRRLFSVPEAYLYALTPSPRRVILLASVFAAAILDIVTMAVVIAAEKWLSLMLTGGQIWQYLWNYIRTNSSELPYRFWYMALLAAGYLLVMMIILFYLTVKNSILYKFPASKLLAFLLACACFYVVTLLQLVLVPFGTVDRYGLMIILNLGKNALPFYVLLILLEASGLFVINSKLMERKINL